MRTTAREIPIQYDESTRTYRLSHDRTRDASISTTVVLAVGEITDTPPFDMEPMHDAVDSDALDDLYAPVDAAAVRRSGWSTFFRFHGCGVTVYSTGEIEIEPFDDGERDGVALSVPRVDQQV